MAFMGVVLGLFARIAYEQGMFEQWGYAAGSGISEELGLPLFLRTVLPVGLMGIMMSAYFSAIMSTADSCLVAASGNLFTDILKKWFPNRKFREIRMSQILTLVIGVFAILLATQMNNVLELMLYSYAIMVSGLLIPLIGMLMLKKPSALAAMVSMSLGGTTTLMLILLKVELPYGLDAILFGISASAISFILIQSLKK
jgi:SSS family solute:Na+ symporter